MGKFSDGTPITEASLKAWKALSMEVRAERNLKQLDRLVVSWDTLVNLLDSEEYRINVTSNNVPSIGGDRSIVLFLHIPKVGGSTLAYVLNKNHASHHSIHANAPELEHKPYLLFKRDMLCDLVMGHHRINSILYQLLNRPVIHMTMLRDPVSRVVSYYDYLYTSKVHPLRHKAKQMTLQEFIESKEIVELENAQSRRLVGNLHRSPLRKKAGQFVSSSWDDTDQLLKDAKETLTNRFSLFGLTNDYTRFLLMAKKLLFWRDIYYVRKNVSKQKTVVADIEPSVLDLIRQRNQADIALFDYAKQLFDERCRQLEITQEKVEQYEALNATYQELLFSDQ